MNGPVIWVIFPGILSIILLIFRRWKGPVTLIGTLGCILLALVAWQSPIGEVIHFGPWSFEISGTLNVLGRRLILNSADRPLMVLIYMGTAFWFTGSMVANVQNQFVPLGLGISSLMTSALLVEPFLYAALIFELAVIVSVPMLVSSGTQVGRGIFRYLTFQTLGMPFILFSGWILSGVEANPGDSVLAVQSAVILILGFSLLLAVFPFNTWIPMLAEETHPYSAAFLLFMLPLAVSLFGLNFLEQYSWFITSPWLLVFLRLSGFLMLISGGLWAAFQRHLGRLMGYAVIIGIGYLLLSLSLGVGQAENKSNLELYFALLLPRGLSIGIMGLALSIIRNLCGGLRFTDIQPVIRGLPLTLTALILALFTMVGFPLLAGFPAYYSLWQVLSYQFPLANYAALFGSAGLLVGGLRTLAILISGSDKTTWQVKETWGQRLLLVAGGIGLLLVGIFPQWFYPTLVNLASLYLRSGS